ncbi:phosphoribosylformylglycinamidine synthase, partial [Candidatus Woesearchaeota archaeon CG08_land_8_20_14_0_20_43_7]
MKKVAVIQFPGTNCEHETKRAVDHFLPEMGADIVRWNETDRLASYDAFIIAGGFSYEDRGRSGVIAANDPVMKVITKEAEKGKPVLG